MRLFLFLVFVVIATHALNLRKTYNQKWHSVRSTLRMSSTEDVQKISPRDERRRILKSSNYNR